MRTQDEAKRGLEKESNGEIRDRHQPQDERKEVQKRAFTRWMNVFLQRCDPPLEVQDLFVDIQDGRMLMALLEELTGCKLLYRFRSSSHRIFRLNNISKALEFLDDRHVKLLSIDASGVADGVPSVVLNLVWIIILHFQVKEVTRGLHRHLSSSLSSLSASSSSSSSDLSLQPNDIGRCSCSTLPSKGRSAARVPKYHGKAIKTLLQWVQRCTSKFGVEVHDFGKSWRSGLAFLALIKSIEPDVVDLRESLSREPRENLELAFMVAHRSFDITPLLEPEGVMCSSPDEQSIITYVSMFLWHCAGKDEDQIRDIGVPDIPNFGSLESVSFGESAVNSTDARAFLRGSGKSREQLLWKRWSRRSPVMSHLSSSDGDIVSSCCHQNAAEQSAATSQSNKKRGRHRQPPSPLDAGIVNPDIRSWMEKSSDQVCSKSRTDESHLSLSSEEGIYNLSVLDSDEEDAYSYILELNKEVFQPYNQLKRPVQRVEEETVEEMCEDSKPLDVCDVFNGHRSKPKEGSDLESEHGAQSLHRKSDWDENCSRPVFDMELEDGSWRIEESEEDRGVGGQVHGEGERAKETEGGYDKTEALTDQAEVFKMADCEDAPEEDRDAGLSGKCVQAGERSEGDEEEKESLTLGEKGQDGRLEKDEAVSEAASARIHTREENERKGSGLKPDNLTENRVKTTKSELTDKKTTWREHLRETTPKNDPDGSNSVPASVSAEGGFILQSLAASCDITPLELEMLLVFWILLYCCFILPQMNLGAPPL